MFRSPFFTWLKRQAQVTKGRPARVRRDALRGKLYLEILEDRTLLTATVTDVAVSGTPPTSPIGVGQTVNIEVDFSQSVNVTGTPTLTLSDGATANYQSGSGGTALIFNYVVGSGDTTHGANLDYASTTALSGTIKDASTPNPNGAANLTLPTLAGASDTFGKAGIVIDGTTPTVKSVTSSPTNSTYGPGGSVTIDVNFSEAVKVTSGTPTLTLSDGETATYSSGSGNSTLLFTYAVQSGDTTNGAALNATALSGNMTNTAKSGTAEPANLSLTGGTQLSASDVVIDTTTPTVTSVTSPTSAGTYGTGETVTLDVNFSEAVTVNTTNGTPTLSLSDGKSASYSSGSGSTTLVFTYTVGAGDTTNGSALDIGTISLNSGTIKSAGGVAANLTINGDAVAGDNIIIDALTPTVTSVTSPTSAGTYGTGATVTLDVNFSEAVTVNTTNGTPTLSLSDGKSASYSSGSGSTTLVFTYTVGAGDTSNGSALDVGTISLNSGTIKNAGGVAANLAINGDAVAGDNIIIDATTPTVTSVTSPTSAGTYGTGATVTLDVNFSEAVTVNTTNGTPTLSLSDGKSASYSSGSGSTTLVFTYTVGAGDTSNGSALDVGTISLNSGTIKNAGGVAANLAINGDAVAGDNIIIDATTPTVTSVTSPTSAGTYGTGATVTLDVNFSEAVTVDTTNGTPTLSLSDGKSASYSSGSGSTTLVFTYTVGAGDTSNGSALDVGTISLNSGTIKNAGGVAANLAINGDAVAGDNIIIDATTPTVTSVTSPTSAGTYGTGATVTLDVNFSEAVTVDTTNGTPTLSLSDGKSASYTSGSGSTTLVFTYTVGAGDTSNGSALDVGTISLNSGTIKNAGGVAANLAINGDAVAGDNIIIDATTPTVTSVTSPTSAGTYGTGATVTLDVNFSEAVTVDTTNGTPTLSLSDGKSASYTSGSGSTTLVFTYTVGAGDTSNGSALDVGTISLNSGTIKNAGGVAANLAINGDAVAGKNIVIDTSTPTVTSVTTSTSSGTYGAGATVNITVLFSEPVNVTGTPTLTLSDGRTASYTHGTGSSTLVFTYTVQSGDTTNGHALDYASATALNLSGGTIKSAAGTAAVLTLPTPGGASDFLASDGIVIHAVSPTPTPTPTSTSTSTSTPAPSIQDLIQRLIKDLISFQIDEATGNTRGANAAAADFQATLAALEQEIIQIILHSLSHSASQSN